MKWEDQRDFADLICDGFEGVEIEQLEWLSNDAFTALENAEEPTGLQINRPLITEGYRFPEEIMHERPDDN